RERDEGRLGGLLSEVRIAELSQGCGIDDVDVSPDQLAERLFRTLGDVNVQQLQISMFIHVHQETAGGAKRGQAGEEAARDTDGALMGGESPPERVRSSGGVGEQFE